MCSSVHQPHHYTEKSNTHDPAVALHPLLEPLKFKTESLSGRPKGERPAGGQAQGTERRGKKGTWFKPLAVLDLTLKRLKHKSPNLYLCTGGRPQMAQKVEQALLAAPGLRGHPDFWVRSRNAVSGRGAERYSWEGH